MIVDVGGVVSVDAVAGVSPDISVAGCTPMSANRFTVACCMAGSVLPVSPAPLSRPHDHCTVPAPNTRAPLGGAVQGQVVGGGAVELGVCCRSR